MSEKMKSEEDWENEEWRQNNTHENFEKIP